VCVCVCVCRHIDIHSQISQRHVTPVRLARMLVPQRYLFSSRIDTCLGTAAVEAFNVLQRFDGLECGGEGAIDVEPII